MTAQTDPAWGLAADRNIDGLVAVLRDGSGQLGDRALAAFLLGGLRARESIFDLTQVLADPDVDVVRASARALGKIADPAAIPALLALAADNTADEPARRLSLDGLASMSVYEAEELLIPYLSSDDRHARRWAAKRIVRVGGANAIVALERARSRDPLRRLRYSNAINACRHREHEHGT